tara:strand:- start:253 stop:579 length:327 start_codon:yes stop_codon:yes gene_type:complete
MTILNITNQENGISFNVRMVNKGEAYGRDNCLTHDKDDALVEFYDARHMHTDHGQFVSRYYASTLTGDSDFSFNKGEYPHGLNLEGSVEAWSVTGENMIDVISWIKEQ